MGLLDAVGILNPGALYLLAIVPALIIAYLARERPRQVVVSSVLAFRALHVMRGERFGGRPRFNWTFFLELLILCLAVLAIAEPFVVHKGNPFAVVLDNSAPMQVRTPSGTTRFETAVAKLKDALRSAAGSGNITVYVTAPEPRQVGSVFTSAGAAISAIEREAASDAPDNPAALSKLLAQLNSNRGIGRIIFAGYRGIASPVPARVTPIVVGEPVANYAIGGFALGRENLGAAALHARLTVANFSPTAQTLRITITGDGKIAGKAETHVAPGEAAGLEFPRLAPAQTYRALLEPSDAFALDNVAYATASAVKQVLILFVSPAPADGEGLKLIPGVGVTTVTPSAYSPKELANSDLAIFEYAIPKELPTVNALLVMPPPGDPVFNFAVQPAARVQLTAWPTTDPLTDGVNFRLLTVHSGEYLAQHSWMQSVVSGGGGGLILAGQRQGHRFVATGFNPFPYLGRKNLPMSVLTLNLLSYLAGFGAQTLGFRTGEPWIVPAGVSEIILPSGRTEPAHPGAPFTTATWQGIYTLVGSSEKKTLRAVNLNDLNASDLENVPPIKLDAAPGGPATEQSVVRTPLAPYVLAAIIGLIVLEAVLVYRRRRPLFELQT
jgi:hypothetical protein